MRQQTHLTKMEADLASISLQASDPWVPLSVPSTSQRRRRLVARIVSIHHILWYALAIRQHSDFGITAAVGRKRPCNRRLVTALVPNRLYSNIAGGMDMASSANNPRAALADILTSLLTTAPHRARPAVFGRPSEAHDRLPYSPVAPLAHTRRLAAGHSARHQ